MEVGIKEAKNTLSRLVDAMLEGEEVFLTNRGARVAQLVAAGDPSPSRRGRGFLKGKLNLYPGWDSQAEDEKIAHLFEAASGQ
jgi:antitoxin (DNA-binding transcriptional repressor) of toxin-antitoxin stability system